jgi:mevalonate pyrophosphate decarboxylase
MSYTPKHAKPASASASNSQHGPFGIAETPAGRHARKARREEELTAARARRSVSARA